LQRLGGDPGLGEPARDRRGMFREAATVLLRTGRLAAPATPLHVEADQFRRGRRPQRRLDPGEGALKEAAPALLPAPLISGAGPVEPIQVGGRKLLPGRCWGCHAGNLTVSVNRRPAAGHTFHRRTEPEPASMPREIIPGRAAARTP